jgi:CPA1 family monovalent cation:H+ antiporter
MESLHTFIILMFAAAFLVGIAQKLQIAYPIALVIGGTLLGFMPRHKPIEFDPNILLTIVLPPILYSSSFSISFREFKKNWKDIFSLALGLVFITTLIVGVIFKAIFPQFPWALAFAFGAIISPPDAIAASAILKRFTMSPKLLSVLEGESLVNDASALVLYRLAIVALFSGVFSLGEAGFEFFKIVFGGVAVGLIFGLIVQRFSREYLGPIVGVVLSITIPYMTYIIADKLGVSGVLAVVANGLVGAQTILSHPSPLRRIAGFLMWDIFSILMNCFVFILIGLYLRILTREMTPSEVYLNVGYGVLFTFILIAVRMLWIYGKTSIHYLLNKGNDFFVQLKEATLLGWSGMRGIVSLTAALAIPVIQKDGTILDGREEAIFITFIVILLTLLIPGLTIAPLIRALNLDQHTHPSDHKIRKALTQIAKSKIEELNEAKSITTEEYTFLSNYFNMQRYALEIATSHLQKFRNLEMTRHLIIQEQRKHLIKMWKRHEASDHQLGKIEHELDLEETRMARAELI